MPQWVETVELKEQRPPEVLAEAYVTGLGSESAWQYRTEVQPGEEEPGQDDGHSRSGRAPGGSTTPDCHGNHQNCSEQEAFIAAQAGQPHRQPRCFRSICHRVRDRPEE